MDPKSRGGSGKLSRRSALALVAGGGILSLTGSGAFSEVDTNRSFGVTTAKDDEALLQLTGLELPYEEGAEIEITDKSGGSINSVSIRIIGGSNSLHLNRKGATSQSIDISDFESSTTFSVVLDDSDGCPGNSGGSSGNPNGCPGNSGSSSGNSNRNDADVRGEIRIIALGPDIEITLERKIMLKRPSDSGDEEDEDDEDDEDDE